MARGSKCFVAGCRSGYESDRKKRKELGFGQLSLFVVPKDPELFQIWQRIIPRADRKVTQDDVICELHFQEEDIERFYETMLPGNILHRFRRGKVKLKANAIPTRFPNYIYDPSLFKCPLVSSADGIMRALSAQNGESQPKRRKIPEVPHLFNNSKKKGSQSSSKITQQEPQSIHNSWKKGSQSSILTKHEAPKSVRSLRKKGSQSSLKTSKNYEVSESIHKSKNRGSESFSLTTPEKREITILYFKTPLAEDWQNSDADTFQIANENEDCETIDDGDEGTDSDFTATTNEEYQTIFSDLETLNCVSEKVE